MKTKFTLLLSVLALLVKAQLLTPQPYEVTERYYPDPDIEINTPGFEDDSFTDYESMMEFLNGLQSEFGETMSIQSIGQSQEGVDIPMVTLSGRASSEDGLRVYMQGGLHGDEPGSTEAMLFLIQQVLKNPEYAHLLDSLTLGIVPMANVDGYEDQVRDATNGLDLNRDQTKLMAPETIALKNAFFAFDPHIAVDFHEYRPNRRDFQNFGRYGVTGAYDVMFLYSGNLNVPAALRNFTKDQFVDPAAQVLDNAGLSNHDYFSTRDVMGAVVFNQGSMNARSSATNYALANTISTLIEVRGVGLGRTSFKRRVYSSFLVATSYLQTAYENVEEVKAVLDKSTTDESDVVLEIDRPMSEANFTVNDNALREQVQISAFVRDAWKSEAVRTRPRPTAYIIPASYEHLIEKLRTLGLEVEPLSMQMQLSVEKYVVTEYWRDAAEYEGTHVQDVTTETESFTFEAPAGTYVVRMNQRRSNMAIELLEPETPNSFVSFGLIELEEGAELPYYRISNELPAAATQNR
ncbi:MAG: succinylglutamate desuccinylase/aspartoacylase family protein [Flavobacteriia bacterium]|nr:succinylglutamate desuccinylase/aspartoacylase family protein [Flavobacteriia bacterium]